MAIYYIMLAVMGASTSGVYSADPNGAIILRKIV
jgi:hypothetical protein